MKENKKDETGSNIKSKIEAIIFASGQPVKISKLSQFLKIGVRQCQEILEEISQEYKNQKRGLKIIFKSGQVQMVSADIFGEDVAKFLNKELNDELSRAALEVLAVIAYRGPISRADIEYIRGVNCSFTLRNLAMRGLIDRNENPNDNRSYLYEISFDCLRSLGISKREELFDYENLSRKEKPEQIKEEENKEDFQASTAGSRPGFSDSAEE